MRFRAWITLVAVAGCTSHDAAPTTEVAPEPLAIAPTTTDKPKDPGYVGVLTPREAVEITAPFTTNVDEYLVNLGDHVEAGATLALLDEAPLQEQLAIAKAELKASQAEVAQASVSRAAAKAAMRREKAGVREGIASKADLSDATFKSREAGAGVARAVANVEQQKARIAALETKLHDMTLTTPIAGKVSLRYVEAGHRVDEGRPIIRVISSDEMFVKFAIPTEHVGRVAPGDRVDVFIEARGVKAPAVVKSVAPELDPVAQMILGEAELADPAPEKLQSGMVCRIFVDPNATKPN